MSISTRAFLRGFFGDTQEHIQHIRIRANQTLTTESNWSYNGVCLPNGDFMINPVQTRLSFPGSVFRDCFNNSDNAEDLWSANLRLGWLQSASTGSFIVFNDVSESSQPFHNSLGPYLWDAQSPSNTADFLMYSD